MPSQKRGLPARGREGIREVREKGRGNVTQKCERKQGGKEFKTITRYAGGKLRNQPGEPDNA